MAGIEQVKIDNVTIVGQEDESLRATEYIVTTELDDGTEEGFKFVVGYNGHICYVGSSSTLIDGVDIV